MELEPKPFMRRWNQNRNQFPGSKLVPKPVSIRLVGSGFGIHSDFQLKAAIPTLRGRVREIKTVISNLD